MAALDLHNAVIDVLRCELGSVHAISLIKDQILVQISTADFEHGLGDVLRRIHSLIDLQLPKRNQHLSLIIRDVSQGYENVFKICRSVL